MKDESNSRNTELPIKKTTGETLKERLSENAYERILPARYLRKNPEGEPVESQEELFERVAKNIALADALYEAQRLNKTIKITPKNIKDNHSKRDKLVEKVFGERLPPEEAEEKGLEKNLTENNVKHLSYDNLLPDLPEEVAEHVKNVKQNYQEQMEHLKLMPNSPALMNAGDELQQMSACFVLSPDDDMEEIHEKAKEASLIFKSGGGTGYGFWKLRPKGDIVGSSGGVSSGPISFMRIYDEVCGTVSQAGKRRGAQMGVMRVTHPDIIEFIHSKRKDVSLAHTLKLNDPDDFTHNSFREALEEARELINEEGKVPEHLRNAMEGHLSNFNISVGITDDFMEAVYNDEEFTFTNPRTGEDFIANEETVEMYDMFGLGEYVKEGEVLSVPAKEIWDHIIEGAHENGEPGVVFLERMNKEIAFDPEEHPEKRVYATNPSLASGTKVLTENGIKEIQNLEGKNFKVPTLTNEWAEAECFLSGHDEELYEIELESGKKYYATQEHKWIVGKEKEKKKTDELEEGDFLPQTRQSDLGFGNQGDYDDGFLAGFIYGDGSITDRENRGRQVSITISQKDRDNGIYDKILTLLKEVTGFEYTPTKRKRDGKPWYEIHSNNEEIKEFLDKYKLDKKEKGLPNSLFKFTSEKFRKGFVDGLISADGYVDEKENRIVFRTSRKEMAEDFSELMNWYGIQNYIRKQETDHSNNDKYNKDKYDAYSVTISKGSCLWFREVFSLTHEGKNDSLREIDDLKQDYISTTHKRISNIRKTNSKEDVWDIHVDHPTHSFKLSECITGNCGEQELFDYDACNLKHINLSTILDNDCSVQDYREFSEGREDEDVEEVVGGYLDQVVDWSDLDERVHWGTRFLDNVVTMSDFPVDKIEDVTRENRKIGLGVMGYAQMLVQMGVEYGSEEANEIARQLMNYINDESVRVSQDLAVNDGKPGMGRGVFEDWDKSKWSDPVEYKTWFEEEYTDGVAEEWEDGFPVRNHSHTTVAPTGCVLEGSTVSTPEGLVRIDDFVDEDSKGKWNSINEDVCSDDGVVLATNGFENGESDIRRITTEKGFEVSSTEDHKFRVINEDGEYVWKRADEIDVSDSLVLRKDTTSVEDSNVELDTSEKDNFHHNTDDSLVLPEKLTPELSEFLGFYVGDGYVHDEKSVNIAVDSEKDELFNYIMDLSKEVFGVNPTVEDKGHVKMICVGGRHITRYFEDNGWRKERGNNGEGSANARVPSQVMRGGVSNMNSFIKGFVEADGTAPRKVEMVSSSENLLKDIQDMLLSIGIVFKREKKQISEEAMSERFGDRDMYVLRGLNKNEDKKFVDEVGLVNKSLDLDVDVNSYEGDDYPGELIDELRDMDGYYDVNDSLRSCLDNARDYGHISRGTLKRFFENDKVNVDEESLVYKLYSDFFVDEVSGVEKGTGYTLDLEVPENRTYIANGFVSHNTTSMIGNTSGGCEPIYSVANFKNVTADIQGEDMLVQFDDFFLRVLEANDVDVEAVKEEAKNQMNSNEFDGVDGLETVPDELGELFVTTSDLSAIEHASVQCAFQEGVSSSISKCVEEGTLVQTDQGLVPIEEFSEDNPSPGEFVEANKGYTINGTEIISQYYAGKKSSTKIRLDSGEEITGATNSHKVMTSDGWKNLGDIKEGDVIIGRLEESHGNGGMSIDWDYDRDDNPMHDVAINRVNMPDKMTDNLAKLLGIYAADGGLTHGSYKFSISTSSEEIRDLSFNLIEEVFGIQPKIKEDKRFGDGRDTVYDVCVNSKPVYQFVKDLCSYGSRNKRVPKHILQGSKNEKKEFISGVTLDGYATNQSFVVYEGLSENLAYHVAQLIRSFGKTHVYIGRKWVEKSNKYAYSVHVSNEAHDIVEPLESHKEVDKRTKRVKTCVPYDSLDETEFYSKSKNYSIIRNKKRRESDVMYKKTAERIGLENHDIAYKVTHVEDVGEKELYDIEMEEDHEYLINGVISHNTINAPNEATVDDTREAFEYVYDNGGKGVTYYRDGTRSKQVLTTRRDNQEFADEGDLLEAVRDMVVDEEGEEFVEDLVSMLIELKDEEEFVLEELAGGLGSEVREIADGENIGVSDSNLGLSEYRKRPDNLVGATVRVNTGYGTLYVTLNEDENGELFEVFAEIGKSGGLKSSFTEGISRMVSMSLRYGVPPERIMKHLSGIKSAKTNWDNGDTVHSVPDGIALALERYLNAGGVIGLLKEQRDGLDDDVDEEKNEEDSFSRDLDSDEEECPECSNTDLDYGEGCLKCHECGWSKC